MDYSGLSDELTKIIMPLLEAEGLELIEFKFRRGRSKSILKLLVDKKDGGINLDECAKLNERIGNLLDSYDIIQNRYILEVSSPGLDRPLVIKNDFSRCINKKVKFFLKEPIAERVELDGVVARVEDKSVFIDKDGEVVEVGFSNIAKAKRIITDI